MRRPEDFISLSPWSRPPPQPRQHIPPSSSVTALATSNKLNDILITNQKATCNRVGENAAIIDDNILDSASRSAAEGCEPDDVVDSIRGGSEGFLADDAVDHLALGSLHLVAVELEFVTPSHSPDYITTYGASAVVISCDMLDRLAQLEKRCL